VATLADDHGHVANSDVKAIEQRLHARIGFDVLVGEGLPVAAQELTNVLRAPGVTRAEQDHVVRVLGHQGDTSQDERPHEDLAQLRVALNERPEVVAVDGNDRTVARHPCSDETATGGKHVDLTGELARVVNGDWLLTIPDGPDDLELAG
jgi:hypothetical protein